MEQNFCHVVFESRTLPHILHLNFAMTITLLRHSMSVNTFLHYRLQSFAVHSLKMASWTTPHQDVSLSLRPERGAFRVEMYEVPVIPRCVSILRYDAFPVSWVQR